MEKDCAAPSSWGGPVGAVLSSQLYISCVGDSDEEYEKAVQELLERARQKVAELKTSGQ
jgi:hypothetical protein